MKKLAHRSTEPELMDNPDLEIATLKKVFADINRINAVLAANRLTQKKLWQTVKKDVTKSYMIYDFGCGDGALLRELADFLRKRKVGFKMVGLDISAKAITIAKENSTSYPEISYSEVDILKDEVDIKPCDILLCGLTLHHFSSTKIPLLLQRLIALTRQEIIINDLKRSHWACLGFKIISTLFLRTKIAKNDGLISIKSGFTKTEIEGFTKKLTGLDHNLKWFPNFRFIWSIKKPQFN